MTDTDKLNKINLHRRIFYSAFFIRYFTQMIHLSKKNTIKFYRRIFTKIE